MLRTTLVIAAMFALATTANAQFELTAFTLEPGGTTSGGDFELSFTIGQQDAFTTSGGGYEFTGGFWAIAFADDDSQLIGDTNCDGIISVSDIGPFVLALTDPAGYAAQFPNCEINNADTNDDGQISVGDIGPFVALLSGV